MSTRHPPIEGSVIIVGLDVAGAAIAVPMQRGRDRFTGFGVDAEGAYLTAASGSRTYLAEADETAAVEAAQTGVVVVREMDLDGGGEDLEYAVAILDIDLPRMSP